MDYMFPEEWEYVREFPGYMVSNLGQVKHARLDRILPQRADRYGYLKVRITTPNGQYWYYVDEMVAKHFLPDYVDGCKIEHVDGNIQYNGVDNLRCLQEEVWKPIPEFPRYDISSHCRVRNGSSGRILRPDIAGSVLLNHRGVVGRRSVNKLFREAFGR